jgi:hypothetical protein
MHGKFHLKDLSDADLNKGTRETPINSTQPGKAPTRSDPCLAHSPPREGGGELAQSGGGRPLGVPDPLPAPLCLSFDRQWHAPCKEGAARSLRQE